MDDAERGANAIISIDLEKQEIRGPDGGCVRFDIDPFRKQCLLNGWDDIGLSLRHDARISAFEARAKRRRPGCDTPILLLPGDGIGPEVTEETQRVLGWFAKNRNFAFQDRDAADRRHRL